MANRYPLEDVELGNNKTVKCVTTKFNGRKIFEFRGIKYGKPPVGDMRFKVRNEHLVLFILRIVSFVFEYLCFRNLRRRRARTPWTLRFSPDRAPAWSPSPAKCLCPSTSRTATKIQRPCLLSRTACTSTSSPGM